ncbi:MAG TPA: VanW family protein [Abditibacteriaceae bacterium]|jgi:hypothetical protein
MTRALEPASRRIPTLHEAALFRCKATLLQARRAMFDPCPDARCHARAQVQEFPYVWAQSVTPLWSDEHGTERLLQQGKVQNLRCAARRLNGACIPPGGLFSFWKQIGPATTRRGYAAGRLLREGCLIPAVGGGLCQLSNALYDVALQSGCEIVERHAHSRTVPGSSAQTGRDATVAWNYIDLRFHAPRHACRSMLIAARLSAQELIVELRGQEPLSQAQAPITSTQHSGVPLTYTSSGIPLDVQAHSCTTCAQNTCFRHLRLNRRDFPVLAQLANNSIAGGKKAFLLDEYWPEWQNHVTDTTQSDDYFCVPLHVTNPRLKSHLPQHYNWCGKEFKEAHSTPVITLQRAVRARRFSSQGARRLQHELDGAAALAGHFALRLPLDAAEVCVAQSLLPHLWRDGALGGRRFDVLMARLPLRVLHARLDAAWERHPERSSLCEFRAPQWLVELESEALEAARHIITPHAEIAALFAEKSVQLPWHVPFHHVTGRVSRDSRRIAFPGPTAARKGAYELRNVARELDCEVVLLGSELEGSSFWDGVRVQRRTPDPAGLWCRDTAVVVQPALVEERPHRLLQAMALGVPIVASTACGLPPGDEPHAQRVLVVPPDNQKALRDALASVLDGGRSVAKDLAKAPLLNS